MSRADITTEARTRFEEAAAVFDSAASGSGLVERNYRIANRFLRLRFAGPALLPLLTPALAHLELGRVAVDPELIVLAWDSASTGTARPPLGPQRKPGELIVRPLFRDGRFTAFAQPDERVLNVLDAEHGVAAFWADDAASLPYWEAGAPLRLILNWWLAPHGVQLVHAAALGTAAGGVLLAGPGGSGKSTTALASLRAGLRFAADDYVLMTADPPHVYSLYGTAKLDTVERFPDLAPAVWNSDKLDEEKAIVFVNRRAPEALITNFPLRALLAPRVVNGADSSVRPIGAAEALRALAPSTLLQLPGGGDVTLATMTAVAERLPCYELKLGSDLDAVASCLSDLVGGLNA